LSSRFCDRLLLAGRPHPASRLRRCRRGWQGVDRPLAPCFGEPFFFAAGFPGPGLGAVVACPFDAATGPMPSVPSASHCTKPHRAASQAAPRPSSAGRRSCGASPESPTRPTRPVPRCRAWVSARWGHPLSVAAVLHLACLTWKVVVGRRPATRGWWVTQKHLGVGWARPPQQRRDRAAHPAADAGGRFSSEEQGDVGWPPPGRWCSGSRKRLQSRPGGHPLQRGQGLAGGCENRNCDQIGAVIFLVRTASAPR